MINKIMLMNLKNKIQEPLHIKVLMACIIVN